MNRFASFLNNLPAKDIPSAWPISDTSGDTNVGVFLDHLERGVVNTVLATIRDITKGTVPERDDNRNLASLAEAAAKLSHFAQEFQKCVDSYDDTLGFGTTNNMTLD